MKLLRLLSVIILLVPSLGEIAWLAPVCLFPCPSVVANCSPHCRILMRAGDNNLRALKKKEKTSNKKMKTVAGVTCNKSCMEETMRCDKKCEVSGTKVECKNGKLPRKCRKECCDLRGEGGDNGQKSTKGAGVTSGVVEDLVDLEEEVDDLEDKMEDLEDEIEDLKKLEARIEDLEDDVEDIEKDCCS